MLFEHKSLYYVVVETSAFMCDVNENDCFFLFNYVLTLCVCDISNKSITYLNMKAIIKMTNDSFLLLFLFC